VFRDKDPHSEVPKTAVSQLSLNKFIFRPRASFTADLQGRYLRHYLLSSEDKQVTMSQLEQKRLEQDSGERISPSTTEPSQQVNSIEATSPRWGGGVDMAVDS